MKIVLKIVLLPLVLALLYFNLSFYYQPDFAEDGKFNKSVYQQLQFLKGRLREGGADSMQEVYPEGFVFINAAYGLSWCNVIKNLPPKHPIYEEGLKEVDWILKELHSSRGKAPFSDLLPLPYGALYVGWTNYVLAHRISLSSEEDSEVKRYADKFTANCEQIGEAMKSHSSPFLPSHFQQCWPADMLAAVASLNQYSVIMGSNKYDSLVRHWTSQLPDYLDPETGLIPHYVEYETGMAVEGSRGSSQSLGLIFLADLDSVFAKEQFQIYKDLFLDSRFGLPGVREYPKGINGFGDVDSGPVILDIGGVASIVGQRTMGRFGDWTNYEGLRNCIETFGAGYTQEGQKCYIFGRLPMADAFIAWGNSVEHRRELIGNTENWRWRFQVPSILMFLLLVYWLRK